MELKIDYKFRLKDRQLLQGKNAYTEMLLLAKLIIVCMG